MNKLTAMREFKDLTVRELARLAGTTENVIHYIEDGGAAPDYLYYRIADALGVDATEIGYVPPGPDEAQEICLASGRAWRV